jgi:hypothetical protein
VSSKQDGTTSEIKNQILTENDMLRYEVAEMQKQLQYCYNRIRILEAELFDLRGKQSVNSEESQS